MDSQKKEIPSARKPRKEKNGTFAGKICKFHPSLGVGEGEKRGKEGIRKRKKTEIYGAENGIHRRAAPASGPTRSDDEI